MSRIWLSLPEEYIDLLDRYSADLGVSKSTFVEILLMEHEERLPVSIKYKDLISIISHINTVLDEILIDKSFDFSRQLLLESLIKDFNEEVKRILT